MEKILVAYTTNAGSTEDVARAIGSELGKGGAVVDVRRLEEIADLAPYGTVIVGAPMILGWHRAAVRFVKKNQPTLRQKKVAYFMTAMSLTKLDEASFERVPLCVDPGLAKPPRNPDRLNFRERYATVANYLRPVLKAAGPARPLSIAFLGGKLELFRLNIFQMLFVILAVQAQPGNLQDLSLAREWAAGLL